MQYHWLVRNKNKKLIVFFSGWGFDFNPFSDIPSSEYDVLMFYDYNNLDFPAEIPDDYAEKVLIAWSMGVFIAYLLEDKLPCFTKRIAVNGTPYPIHDELGIPVRTFDITLKNAAKGLEGKFYRNVFASEELYNRYLKNPVKRSIKNRVYELETLYRLISASNPEYDDKFYNYAYIGGNDRIIPAKNQINMWKDKAVPVESGHFIFYNLDNWDKLCM